MPQLPQRCSSTACTCDRNRCRSRWAASTPSAAQPGHVVLGPGDHGQAGLLAEQPLGEGEIALVLDGAGAGDELPVAPQRPERTPGRGDQQLGTRTASTRAT